MKGFIEITEKTHGTILININYIISMRPLFGALESTTEILLMSSKTNDLALKYVAKETYDKIKSLVENSL